MHAWTMESGEKSAEKSDCCLLYRYSLTCSYSPRARFLSARLSETRRTKVTYVVLMSFFMIYFELRAPLPYSHGAFRN